MEDKEIEVIYESINEVVINPRFEFHNHYQPILSTRPQAPSSPPIFNNLRPPFAGDSFAFARSQDAQRDLIVIVKPVVHPCTEEALEDAVNHLLRLLQEVSKNTVILRHLYRDRPLGMFSAEIQNHNWLLRNCLQSVANFLKIPMDPHTLNSILTMYTNFNGDPMLNMEELNHIIFLQCDPISTASAMSAYPPRVVNFSENRRVQEQVRFSSEEYKLFRGQCETYNNLINSFKFLIRVQQNFEKNQQSNLVVEKTNLLKEMSPVRLSDVPFLLPVPLILTDPSGLQISAPNSQPVMETSDQSGNVTLSPEITSGLEATNPPPEIPTVEQPNSSVHSRQPISSPIHPSAICDSQNDPPPRTNLKRLSKSVTNDADRVLSCDESVSPPKISKTLPESNFMCEKLIYLENEKLRVQKFSFNPATAEIPSFSKILMMQSLPAINPPLMMNPSPVINSVESAGKIFKYQISIVNNTCHFLSGGRLMIMRLIKSTDDPQTTAPPTKRKISSEITKSLSKDLVIYIYYKSIVNNFLRLLSGNNRLTILSSILSTNDYVSEKNSALTRTQLLREQVQLLNKCPSLRQFLEWPCDPRTPMDDTI